MGDNSDVLWRKMFLVFLMIDRQRPVMEY